MTERDIQFLKVLDSIGEDMMCNSIYIAKELELPRTQKQSLQNLTRLARLEKSGFVKSFRMTYEAKKHWKITDKGRDALKEAKLESTPVQTDVTS